MDAADDAIKFDHLITELEAINPKAADEAKKLKGHMDDAATGGKLSWRSFGTSAIGQITSISGAYLSIEKAIDIVVAANRKVLETNKQIFDSLKETKPGDSRLLQVAKDDADFNSLRDKADSLSMKEGIGREDAATYVLSKVREL